MPEVAGTTAPEILLELAERCEKADAPSATLNLNIAQAVLGGVVRTWPAYTDSVDAALTLVDLEAGSDGNGHAVFPYISRVATIGGPAGWEVTLAQCFDRATAKAATPALALCAAALKARANG